MKLRKCKDMYVVYSNNRKHGGANMQHFNMNIQYFLT